MKEKTMFIIIVALLVFSVGLAVHLVIQTNEDRMVMIGEQGAIEIDTENLNSILTSFEDGQFMICDIKNDKCAIVTKGSVPIK